MDKKSWQSVSGKMHPMTTPSDLLAALNWRYATKSFDASKVIEPSLWGALEQSLILTPSSFGLQPWKFIVIQDKELRESLVPHTWRQRQIVDCSHLVVLTVKKLLGEADVDAFITRIIEVRGGTPEALLGFRKMMLGSRDQMAAEPGSLTQWAKLQSYIALGQFMACAALLGLDTCPMEGFDAAKYDELLGLDKDGLTTSVLCPVGYRSGDDLYATLPKVRFEAKDIVEYR
jgi:nitroreductase